MLAVDAGIQHGDIDVLALGLFPHLGNPELLEAPGHQAPCACRISIRPLYFFFSANCIMVLPIMPECTSAPEASSNSSRSGRSFPNAVYQSTGKSCAPRSCTRFGSSASSFFTSSVIPSMQAVDIETGDPLSMKKPP